MHPLRDGLHRPPLWCAHEQLRSQPSLTPDLPFLQHVQPKSR